MLCAPLLGWAVLTERDRRVFFFVSPWFPSCLLRFFSPLPVVVSRVMVSAHAVYCH